MFQMSVLVFYPPSRVCISPLSSLIRAPSFFPFPPSDNLCSAISLSIAPPSPPLTMVSFYFLVSAVTPGSVLTSLREPATLVQVTSFNMIVSSLSANFVIPFSSQLSSLPQCRCTTFSLSISWKTFRWFPFPSDCE